jgi:hypothetical protein
VQTGSARIEAMRFSLLIVLTIGLLSVAFRVDSHSSSHLSNRAHAPGVSSPTGSPSTPSQVLPTATTRTSGPGSGSGAGGGSGAGSTGAGGTGAVTPAQPQLPVTGWQDAVRLSALSLVLIGAGVMSVRAAGPRRRRPTRRV